MKVSIVQTSAEWMNPLKSLAWAEAQIDRLPSCDIIVLPEMFPTGFVTSPAGIAEKDGMSLEWMKKIAARCDAAVTGSVSVEAEDGTFRNRMYFVKPDGRVEYYDKHHLFSLGSEHLEYTAGNERVIVEWRGVKILLQVCYDLRFPVFSRNAAHGGTHDGTADYDMIIYVAAWPSKRSFAWKSLLVARAIENQCYVVGVNRCGDEPGNHYEGGSMILDYYGKTLAAAENDKVSTATAGIDIEALRHTRTLFCPLNDSDKFKII